MTKIIHNKTNITLYYHVKVYFNQAKVRLIRNLWFASIQKWIARRTMRFQGANLKKWKKQRSGHQVWHRSGVCLSVQVVPGNCPDRQTDTVALIYNIYMGMCKKNSFTFPWPQVNAFARVNVNELNFEKKTPKILCI